MTKQDDAPESLLNPDKIEWLRDHAGKGLTQNQQALLLAMAQLETELGRQPTAAETQALESLAGQMEGFDPTDIASAIHRVVNQPTNPDRKVSWPKLKKRSEAS